MKMQWAAVCLGLVLGLPAAATAAKLELSDGKYPLWELRPLDRRVYVISLDGNWKTPPVPRASYMLTVRFPNGRTYSHRPINELLFQRGEMRFMVPEYLLVRTGVARGGKLDLYVTQRLPAGAGAEVISNTVTVSWPPRRSIARRPPLLKHSPPPPIDRFPLPDETDRKDDRKDDSGEKVVGDKKDGKKGDTVIGDKKDEKDDRKEKKDDRKEKKDDKVIK